jgi:branched-chain amino acid transport system permease protein
MSMYYAGILADVGILALGALSVYIILSTGQLSLGNAGFMGIGAYLTSWLTVKAGLPLTPSLMIAALVSGVIGVVVGFPALVMLLETSQIWLEIRAVRDDETAAGLVGLNATEIKVGAFGCGAAVAAIAGGLFAHHNVYIEPGNFSFERSIDFVLAVILGGSTVAPGALAGAVILVILPEYLRFLADWRSAAFGALLIGMLVVRRQGLLDRAVLRFALPSSSA